ncbi:hypothetical protein WME79_29300 [Sorangium sp. So ce726]|uniref:hypothetical protein n=1 Tax=Sorangium sp. So ce726 TaxID=3133319 RepID=UPI003F643AA0
MRMALLRMRAAALAALAWGSACGGNVVVDGMPDGSGGAGATSSVAITTGAFGSSAISTGTSATSAVSVGVGVGGSSAVGTGVGGSSAVGTGVGGSSAVSSSATSMATSGIGSSSSGAGGGDAWSRCVGFCERYEEACGAFGPGQCEASCEAQLSEAPQCNDLLAQFFDCATHGSIDCTFGFQRCQPFLDKYDECWVNTGCTGLECVEDRDRACSCKGSCPNAAFAVECRPDRRGNTISCSCFVNGELLSTCQDVGPACDLAYGCCGPLFEFR